MEGVQPVEGGHPQPRWSLAKVDLAGGGLGRIVVAKNADQGSFAMDQGIGFGGLSHGHQNLL
jgi:hypothetical protein